MSFFRYFMLICNCLWIILNFLKHLWFFDTPLLYYYITLSSSIISYLSIILECELFGFFSNFISNQNINCFFFFWIALAEAVFTASVADCFAWSRHLWLYLPLKIFNGICSIRQKSIAFLEIFEHSVELSSSALLSSKRCHFLCFTR